MTLKLGPIADEKPVKVTVDIPADVYRDLSAYADLHAVSTGQMLQGPVKLIVPMIAQFMESDREFVRLKRQPVDRSQN